ncbi:hypothetical protein ACIBSR_34195 [Streptomyces sp. NPDC049936]|uniref:hypothetical protein n=1 Tax=Streptomyces sp. NPDC049936 TaxID=3365599 RepID=UPI00378B2C2B
MDLLGTALVLEELGHVVARGGAGVVISTMAGHPLPAPMRPEQDQALAHTPADELPALPFVTGDGLGPAASDRPRTATA